MAEQSNLERTFVYRYIDASDNIVKYVGITNNLRGRVSSHSQDEWAKGKTWIIEILMTNEPLNRTSAMILESHLISMYDTGAWYNIRQTNDGLGQFLSSLPEDFLWELYSKIKVFDDGEHDSKTGAFYTILCEGDFKAFCNLNIASENQCELSEECQKEPVTFYDEKMIYSFCFELQSISHFVHSLMLKKSVDMTCYTTDVFLMLNDMNSQLQTLLQYNDERFVPPKDVINKVIDIVMDLMTCIIDFEKNKMEFVDNFNITTLERILEAKERIRSLIFISPNSMPNRYWERDFLPDMPSVRINSKNLYRIRSV